MKKIEKLVCWIKQHNARRRERELERLKNFPHEAIKDYEKQLNQMLTRIMLA